MISSLLGFLGFNVALFAHHCLAAPPTLFDPQCSKVFGRWLYLTYQSNMIGTVYYGLSLVEAVLGAPSPLKAWLIRLFPLAFATGTFLTLAYYALDHFNPENFRRKERHKAAYPYIHWCSHLEHGHALPLIFLHGAVMELPPSVALPTSGVVFMTVGGYLIWYLIFVHVNHYLTGLWPYAVIDDVTRLGGAALRCVFFAGLTGLFIALGVAGAALLHNRA